MVLLSILLTEKGMDWDTKVRDILGPDYSFVDEYRSQMMTLKDLLSHRAGLARLDFGLLAGYPHSISREEFCKKLKYLPEKIPFRDGFIYNNFLYALLGHIAEKLGGDTWENLVTSKVFDPIGMTSTRILKETRDVLKDDVAKPYIFKDNTFQNSTLEIYSLHPFEPAGAIMSTGEDMAKYIRFNLKGGITEDATELMDLELLLKSFTTTTPTVDSDFLDTYLLTVPEFPISETAMGYGHAWFTSTYRGYRRMWHSGGLMSYITYLWIFPDINAGVFASVNGPGLKSVPGRALRSVLYYISDNLLQKEAWLNETTTCEYPDYWKHKTSNSTPPEPFGNLDHPAEYFGYYKSNYMPGINVTATTENKSALSFQMTRTRGILHPTQDADRFLMEITSPWEYTTQLVDDNNNTVLINTTFTRNAKGLVRSVEVQYEVKVVYTKDTDETSASATFLTYTSTGPLLLLSFLCVCNGFLFA